METSLVGTEVEWAEQVDTTGPGVHTYVHTQIMRNYTEVKLAQYIPQRGYNISS